MRNQADQDAEHDQHDRVRYFEPAGNRPPDDHHAGDRHRQREKLLLPHRPSLTARNRLARLSARLGGTQVGGPRYAGPGPLSAVPRIPVVTAAAQPQAREMPAPPCP